MSKDKLVLTDGTEIILESSQGIGTLCVNAESKDAVCNLWEKCSKENLKQIAIKNPDGETIGLYEDMVLDHVTGSDNADGTVQFTISLRSKTTEELLLEKIAALESGQQTQDAAIGDLGQAVSDIAEGGMQ